MVVQRQAYASFTVHGPHLFNIMPMSIRNLKNCPVDHMKRQRDKSVPDSWLHCTKETLLYMVRIADALHRHEDGDCESITASGHPWD